MIYKSIVKISNKIISFLKKVIWNFNLNSKLSKKLSHIKMLIMDVDGVLTEGGLWIDEVGKVTKRFNVKDGLGIKILMNRNIKIAFVSGGKGGSTNQRACQLGIIDCFTEVKDKLKCVNSIKEKYNLSKNEIAFVGDDINDLVVASSVGLIICPSDAALKIKKESNLVLKNRGGNGAIRELAELILRYQNKKDFQKEWLETN